MEKEKAAKKVILAASAGALVLGGIGIYFLIPPKQPQPKVEQVREGRSYRIGVVVDSDSKLPIFEGAKEKLAEWGYVKGRNITYTVYNAKGDRNKIIEFATLLVKDKPDVILTTSTSGTMPLVELVKGTRQKVVFLSAGDPFKLVESFIKPGGNITGVCSGEAQAVEKRIDLVKKMIPSVRRAAVILNPDAVNYKRDKEIYSKVFPKVGIDLEIFDAPTVNDVAVALKKISGDKFDLLFHGADVFLQQKVMSLMASHALKEGIASVSTDIAPVKAGMLLSYDAPIEDRGRQAVRIVEKVLEGEDPATIPVEMPDKYYFYLNLKTAKSLRLKILPEIVRQADKVFE